MNAIIALFIISIGLSYSAEYEIEIEVTKDGSTLRGGIIIKGDRFVIMKPGDDEPVVRNVTEEDSSKLKAMVLSGIQAVMNAEMPQSELNNGYKIKFEYDEPGRGLGGLIIWNEKSDWIKEFENSYFELP